MKIKNIFFSSVVAASIFTVMAVPTLANSVSWSFFMENRFVSGASNGQYKTMTTGDMTISGSIVANKKTSSSSGTPLEVTITVYTKAGGYIGHTKVQPKVGNYVSFSKDFGRQGAGDYYIEASRAAIDDYDISGSGYLTTK